jgi:hypothetical protein
MTATIPGLWPSDSSDGNETIIDMYTTGSSTPLGEVPQRNWGSPRSTELLEYPTARSSGDELFFDCPTSHQALNMDHNSETSSSPYLMIEPPITDESAIQERDWRRYEPPRELLQSQDITSNEIQSILVPSIERLQAQHIAEEEERAAVARPNRPLARAGRASIRPPYSQRRPQDVSNSTFFR